MRDNTLFSLSILLLLAALVLTGSRIQVITPPPPSEVTLESFHGRYVTALGGDDGWKLTQQTKLDPCGRFTLHHVANGKIALETCYGRYITTSSGCDTRRDCMLRQKTKLGNAEQFDLYELGNDAVAFRTREGRFFTAGDAGQGWEGELAWSVVAETTILDDWEKFTLLQQP